MILTDIRDYLKKHQRVSLMDIAHRFDVDPDVVRSMVAKWVRKGLVEEIDLPPQQCGGCTKCDDKKNELYQWTSGDLKIC